MCLKSYFLISCVQSFLLLFRYICCAKQNVVFTVQATTSKNIILQIYFFSLSAQYVARVFFLFVIWPKAAVAVFKWCTLYALILPKKLKRNVHVNIWKIEIAYMIFITPPPPKNALYGCMYVSWADGSFNYKKGYASVDV